MPSSWSSLLLAAAAASLVRADTIIAYPGQRGNNLLTNGTSPESDPDAEVIEFSHGKEEFPYGMQFAYPCGGLPVSHNRTKWPVTGGAVAVQPGWGNGHYHSQFYMNIGVESEGQFGEPNITYNVVPPIQVNGPSDGSFEGQFCLPNVPLPAGMTFNEGDNITLQVIQLTEYGAALYNCVDLTLVNPNDPELVQADPSNCYNNSEIGIGIIFSTTSLTSPDSAAYTITPSATWAIAVVAVLSVFALL